MKLYRLFFQTIWFNLASGIIFFASCQEKQETGTISMVMDELVSRLYQELPEEELNNLDQAEVLKLITREEREILATRYLNFTVNVPVTVYLMRHQEQEEVPFWLEPAGFELTSLQVKNENYTYQVWQKNFPAGPVRLGINGFDKHRPVYFIAVKPANPEVPLRIDEVQPDFGLETMEKGAFTYHDWSDLILTDVPEELAGARLFTTIRGRAREAHLLNAFRETKFPSISSPDQVLLTWSNNPWESVDIQWRAARHLDEGTVQYWLADSPDTLEQEAAASLMEDRLLRNDRYIQRLTAKLVGLKAESTYKYRAGNKETGTWSGIREFKTAVENEKDYSFVWFGDTHRSSLWGNLLQKADQVHPSTNFYIIAGDLVSTGLYRDEWDEFFSVAGDVFSRKPLMPVPGNHDRQDGLGAWMYQDLFSLPVNGPPEVDPELTYSFEYGNALFLMLDATSGHLEQVEWIEKTLAASKATWKFAVFHFPPYNFEYPYQDFRDHWCPLFEKYQVDIVMGGHIHYYMRSRPIKEGQVVDQGEGTIYTVSVGIPGNHEDIGTEPYAAQRYAKGNFYQRVEIKGNYLKYTTYDKDGGIADAFEINKDKPVALR